MNELIDDVLEMLKSHKSALESQGVGNYIGSLTEAS
jgi:hypothetical protein